MCKPEVLKFERKAKESVFVSIKWTVLESEGSANIYFQNEFDPEVALKQLEGKSINNLKFQVMIHKNNNQVIKI